MVNEVKYVGFFKRLLSYFLDILVFYFIIFSFGFIVGASMNYFDLEKNNIIIKNTELISTILYLSIIVFTITLWVKFGKTPGKYLLGIKIVDANTFEKITLSRAILRYIGYILSMMTFGIGFLIIIFNNKKRGLHDFFGNTVVVYDNNFEKSKI